MGIEFCSLGSGSSGNCQYIGTDSTRLLIDAGFSGKRIEDLLSLIGVCPTTIDYILVTHEHIDHVKGVGVLSRRYDLPILANEKTWIAMNRTIGEIRDRNVMIMEPENDLHLGELGVRSFNIHHDATNPVGYCIHYKDVKISIITDTGWVCDNMKDNIRGSSLYLMESNHDIDMLKGGSYPWHLKQRVLSPKGHMSNVHAGETLSGILEGCGETILLGHLSKENNTPYLAYKTVEDYIEDMGMDVGVDVSLGLTYRNKPTRVYCL
ncbi:MAG: MBL fold metallo-hydrolase [Tissierellia bacterium]|nr:MBL fold metallo-hydrolase [Tissierellia bacterium]